MAFSEDVPRGGFDAETLLKATSALSLLQSGGLAFGYGGCGIALIHSRGALSEVAQRCLFVALMHSRLMSHTKRNLGLGFWKFTAGLHKQTQLCQTMEQ